MGAPASERDEAERGVGVPASEELGGVQGAPPINKAKGGPAGRSPPVKQ
jgi:hypothetical protein